MGDQLETLKGPKIRNFAFTNEGKDLTMAGGDRERAQREQIDGTFVTRLDNATFSWAIHGRYSLGNEMLLTLG
jgi:hypothetical protein